MLKEGEVFLFIDFDDNYSFKWQDEIQEQHWCNNLTELGEENESNWRESWKGIFYWKEVGMRGTFQNEIAHPQLAGKQFHFEMFLRFMEKQICFWKCHPNTLNFFLPTFYV